MVHRRILCVIALLVVFACDRAPYASPAHRDSGRTLFTGGFAATKITLGDKEGALWKALWENGDKLEVASGGTTLGTASLVSGAGSNKGSFSYPDIIADGTTVKLIYAGEEITAEQSKSSTDRSFRTAASASTTINGGCGSFTLTHECIVVRVNVATEAFAGTKLNALTLRCEGKSLNSSGGDHVRINFTDTPELGPNPLEIIFSALPADCTGSEVELLFDLSNGGTNGCVKALFEGKPLEANKVYSFSIQALNNTGSLSAGIIDEIPFYEESLTIRPGLCGIGEPLATTHLKAYNVSGTYTNINGYSDKSVQLIAALGAKTLRMWFEPLGTYSNWAWNTVKMTQEEDFVNFGTNIKTTTHKIFADLKNSGVEEITGLLGCFPRTPSTAAHAGESGYMRFVPMMGTDEYDTFMQYYEWMFKALSAEYPEVDVWEVANETNSGGITYVGNTSLDYNTLAKITVDLCSAAKRGVTAGNPSAKVITPGSAPVSSYKLITDTDAGTTSGTVYRKYAVESNADFLELMYKYIATGSFPSWQESKSSDPDDFFDGVSVHAYDLGSSSAAASSRHPDVWYGSEPINTNDPDSSAFTTFHWLKAIESVYEVMQAGGDSEKNIWITEFGVTTHTKHLSASATPPEGHPYAMRMNLGDEYVWYYSSDEYERQHAWVAKEYMKALATLDFVHTCHFFRLHSPSADTAWSGGSTATMFGLFAEPDETLARGIKPRPIAYAVQELYNGSGDLEMFSTWDSIQ